MHSCREISRRRCSSVQYLSASSLGTLAAILDRAGPLPVVTAEDGASFAPGQVYVAPPDRHLLVQPGRMTVAMGPKENRTRPAIDPLFRSAAAAYGPRVVGVVLSGLLDDGAASLLAIRRCNGVTVVQDPGMATILVKMGHFNLTLDTSEFSYQT